jgi:hypothetical protein
MLKTGNNSGKGKCHVLTSAQEQFWTREFGFEVSEPRFEATKGLLGKNVIPIVEIRDGIQGYLNFPKNSLIALLNSDEKYDYELFKSIIECDAFIGVIRQYKIHEKQKSHLTGVIFFGVFQSLKIIELITVKRTLGWLIEGLQMMRRQMRIESLSKKTNKAIIEIPLGYTNYFAETYLEMISQSKRVGYDKKHSLLEISMNNLNFLNSSKINTFVFIGQSGQIVRRHAIEALKKFNSTNLVVREGYGGVSNDENRRLRIGEEYVDGLIGSKISVCPPGNISGNSYRIMESLICSAYPAVMNNILCDPLFESPVIEVLSGRKPRTWSRYLKKLEEVPHAQLKEKVFENLSKFRDEINTAKLEIEALQARN